MVELTVFIADTYSAPARHLAENVLRIYPQNTKSYEVGALITIFTLQMRKSGQEEATQSLEQV